MTFLNLSRNHLKKKKFNYFFTIFFFIFIKLSKNSSAKYYQDNKERLQKKTIERYQNLSKEEKEKINNMILNVTKISQEMKKVNFLSKEKNIIE